VTTASLMMPDGSNEELLARAMIDVHGARAAAIARENARSAALAGQATQAKSWIGVLAMIQRQQARKDRRPAASSIHNQPQQDTDDVYLPGERSFRRLREMARCRPPIR
jgi:LDH2 family malate/lactate/ureidoglycolate dehydrogenase